MNENLKPISELPPFLKFCYTVGMLPTSYRISMTYEEQVLEAIRFIKEEVIPTINSNALATKELQEKFVKLVNYVESYLDNLDVQDEINNKLDEMVQSGELTEIITQYLQLAGLLCYDNVNAMKNATNIINGSFVKTFGKTAYNDGLGEFYKIREIQNTDVVDEIKIISITTNSKLIAELIPNAKINSIFNILNNKTNIDELNQKRLFSHYKTNGCFENGVGLASICNDFGDNRPQIMGFTNVDTLRHYINRDSAGFYVGNQCPELLLNYQNNDTIFTQTSVQCPSMTEEQITKIKNIDNIQNLVIDTIGVGSGENPEGILAYSALINSFDENTKTFYIKEGFVPKPNIDENFYTPNNGTGIYIGYCTKIWGENIVANLQPNSMATSITGSEIEAKNNRGDVTDSCVIDAISMGAYEIQYGIKSRGRIQRSFYSENPGFAGYVMKSPKSETIYHHLLLDENGNIVSYEKTNGKKSTLKNEIQVISNANQQMSALSGTYIFTAQLSNYQFLSPVSAGSGAIIFIFNGQPEFSVQYQNGTGTQTNLNLRNGGTILLSDGNFWNFIK